MSSNGCVRRSHFASGQPCDLQSLRMLFTTCPPDSEKIKCLLPMPAYTVVACEKFYTRMITAKDLRASICTSRGCSPSRTSCLSTQFQGLQKWRESLFVKRPFPWALSTNLDLWLQRTLPLRLQKRYDVDKYVCHLPWSENKCLFAVDKCNYPTRRGRTRSGGTFEALRFLPAALPPRTVSPFHQAQCTR